jgi:hypothetical protein
LSSYYLFLIIKAESEKSIKKSRKKFNKYNIMMKVVEGHNDHGSVEEVSFLTAQDANGTWLHSQGSDFVFGFLKNDWNSNFRGKVGTAFSNAQPVANIIKEAVKTTSGETIVNGLYLLDQTAMVKAMNSVPGMAQIAVNQKSLTGSGTSADLNNSFFQAILGGLGGAVTPMQNYLNSQMAGFQSDLKKSSVKTDFGTLIGFISGVEPFDTVTTNFTFAYTSANNANTVEKVKCGHDKTHYSWDINYTVVRFIYTPSK